MKSIDFTIDSQTTLSATKIVIANTIYGAHKHQNARIYATLDLIEATDEKVYRNFKKLLDSIYPIVEFESIFTAHHSFYINIVNDGQLIEALLFCDNLVRLQNWDDTKNGAINDIVSCRQVLYDILKPNQDTFNNDIESLPTLNFIRAYEKQPQM